MRLLLLRPGRGSVSIAHEAMTSALAQGLRDRGHVLERVNDTTPGLLHHSRAVLLSKLAGRDDRDTRGLWLDTDIWMRLAPIYRAMRRREQVIVWNYPVRIAWDPNYPPENKLAISARLRAQPFRVWTGFPKTGPDGFIQRSGDGALVELAQCGFGAVLMKPSCARAMHEAYGPAQRDPDGHLISGAFDHEPHPSPRNSEDISFWRRWTRGGGRIWCDPAPYVTNGESGGRFADEIRLREADTPATAARGFAASY